MFGNWRSSSSSSGSNTSSSSLIHQKNDNNNNNNLIQKTIEADRKLFPHCGYSTQQQQSCSSSPESGYVCETINRIQRLCPNEKPITILQSHDTSKNPQKYLDSNNSKNMDHNNYDISSLLPNLFTGKKSLFGGLFTSTPPDPFQRLEDVESELRGIVAGHQSSSRNNNNNNNKFPTVSPSLRSKDTDINTDSNRSYSWSRSNSPNNSNTTGLVPETQYDPKSVERV